MIGFSKKKMQTRSVVEDFTRDEDLQQQIVENKTPRMSRDLTRIKALAAPLIIILIVLILVGVMLSKIVTLSSDVATLKARLAASESLQPRIDRLEKELSTLTTRMAGRQTRIVQQEDRETAVKKAPPSSPRKKTAKPRT
jgi:predicted PurR-regulated permease PerM